MLGFSLTFVNALNWAVSRSFETLLSKDEGEVGKGTGRANLHIHITLHKKLGKGI